MIATEPGRFMQNDPISSLSNAAEQFSRAHYLNAERLFEFQEVAVVSDDITGTCCQRAGQIGIILGDQGRLQSSACLAERLLPRHGTLDGLIIRLTGLSTSEDLLEFPHFSCHLPLFEGPQASTDDLRLVVVTPGGNQLVNKLLPVCGQRDAHGQ
jgi:hypothetical protein